MERARRGIERDYFLTLAFKKIFSTVGFITAVVFLGRRRKAQLCLFKESLSN